MLEEGHNQTSGVQPMGFQGTQDRDYHKSRSELVKQFGPRSETEVAAVHYLQVVVSKADRSERQRRQDCNPHKAVAEIGPQQGWDNHAHHNEQAAHGRGARFLQVDLGTVLAVVLANLEFTRGADHRRANNKANEQRGQAGEHGTESQIAEDSERADVKDEKTLLVQQPIEQILPRSKIYTGAAFLEQFHKWCTHASTGSAAL